MKERIILFGAGLTGQELYKKYANAASEYEVVAFADDYKPGTLFGLPILKPEELVAYEYDTILIASTAVKSIRKRLVSLGINNLRISKSEVELSLIARDCFVMRTAEEFSRLHIDGSVAEAGVFQGEFASVINQAFPQKRLYLFDTFTGFDERDKALEGSWVQTRDWGKNMEETSIELVLSKMPHPERCIIRQGYVPETFDGIEDTFCFVNLDMDLYLPTHNALQWFWPRMVQGGTILIHDYYNYPNLKNAVIQFTEKHHILAMPIGDNASIALIKQEK